MKELTEYYIDLSKLSEEQIKEIGRLITESGNSIYEDTIQVFTNVTHNPNNPYLVWEDCEHAWMDVCGVGGLTELTYPEFIKLFEGGESENNGWIKIESEEHVRNLEISYKTYHGAMDEFVFDSAFNRDSLLKYYKNGELNYYQPIQKPEPPKF